MNLDYIATCFSWFVDHLFTGACVYGNVLSGNVALPNENLTCTYVVSTMRSRSEIVQFVVDSVLSCMTFYSMETLTEIVRVVQPSCSVVVGDDRKSLIARLHECQLSVQPDVVADDLHAIFGPFEHLTRGVLSSLGVRHGLSVEDVC